MDAPATTIPPLPLRAWRACRDRGPGYAVHKAMRRSLGRFPRLKRQWLYADPRSYWTLRGGDDYFREQEGQPARTARAEWMAERIAAYRPISILEVGCGYGKQLRCLRDRLDAPMAGVDFSPSQLAMARNYLDHLTGIELALASGAALPFPDRSFDLVLTSAVILHNPPEVAERIRREVLRVARRFAAHNEDTDVTYNRYGYDTAAWYRARRHRPGGVRADPDRAGEVAVAVLRGRAGAPMTSAAAPARRPTRVGASPPEWIEARRAARDSLIVTVGGQVQRVLGIVTALALRWGLDPARLGVYSGLRVYLDQTNRTSLGVGLGAVQEVPILRAAGRHDEARRVAEVANAANSVTCAAYAGVLLIVSAFWWLTPSRGPLAAEWAGGLAAVAGLALLQRRLSFHVAVLRAHQEFALTTELDVFEGFASAVLVISGLWLAGFWGLLAAVGALLLLKLAYLHARHPLRLGWAWDTPTVLRLMRVGLPIFLSTATFGALTSLDRVLILGCLPDGERALGLYSVALLGTNWTLDAAGRIGMVLYTHFQTTLGRTGDPMAVARHAAGAAEGQAPLLALGAGVAYLGAPMFLGMLLPRYADGLPALRPLLPGMLFLGLSWPARQALVTVGRPYRLSVTALAGIAVAAIVGVVGATRIGMAGIAWGMSAGYAVVFVLSSASAFVGALGGRAWAGHLGRVLLMSAWPLVGAVLADLAPAMFGNRWLDLTARCLLLGAWVLPFLWAWGRRLGWRRPRDRRPKRRQGHSQVRGRHSNREGEAPAEPPIPTARREPRPPEKPIFWNDPGDRNNRRIAIEVTMGTMMTNLLFLVLLVAWSAGVGRAILRRLAPLPDHPADAAALVVPLGLGILSLAALGLGELGGLNRAGLGIVLAVGGVVAIWDASRVARRSGGDRFDPRALGSAWAVGPDVAFDLALAAGIVGSLLVALTPVTDGDALCYHLQVPKEFLSSGSVGFAPDLHETVYPLVTEMLYAVGLAFRGPVACRLIQWAFGLVFAASVTALARPVLGQRARWAGTIALLVPAISNGMGAPLNDVALAAYGCAALVAWLRWFDRPTAGAAVLAGLLAGLALGVKYPAIVWTGMLGLAMLISSLGTILKRRPVSHVGKRLEAPVGKQPDGGLRVEDDADPPYDGKPMELSGWPGQSLRAPVTEILGSGGDPGHATLCPGHPDVSRSLFPRHEPYRVTTMESVPSTSSSRSTRRVDGGLATRTAGTRMLAHAVIFGCVALAVGGAWYLRAFQHTGNPVYPFFRHTFGGAGIDDVLDPIKRPMAVTPGNLLTALGPLTLDPDRFDSVAHQFGPAFLLFLPALALFRPPGRVVAIVGLGWLFLTLCVTQRQSMRFVLIAVGPMSVGVAWLASTWWDRKTAASRLLVLSLLFVLAFEATIAVGRARHGLGVVLGREPAESYLARREPTFVVGRWIDENLPPDARLIGQDHRGFYLPRPYTMELAHRRRTGLAGHGEPPGQIIEALLDRGFTHLMMCPPVPENAVEFDPTLSVALGPWLANQTPIYRRDLTDGDGVVRAYAIYELETNPFEKLLPPPGSRSHAERENEAMMTNGFCHLSS